MPYVKDNSAFHVKDLQKYDNGTHKIVYFSTFNKKVYLGKGETSKTLKDWGIKSKMGLSKLEFVKFLNMINEIKVDAPNPYHLIHEGMKYNGLRTRLVVQRVGEKSLLALVRLVEVKQEDEEKPPTLTIQDSDESEGEPVSSDETDTEADTIFWEDEWEKWYFSNKDRIAHIASGLREWFESENVQQFYKDDEEALATYQGKENDGPKAGGGGGKRKAGNSANSSDTKKKRGKKTERESDLVNELAFLYRFMKQTQCESPEECCLLYNELLTETYNKYYKKENEEEIEDFIFDVYKKCNSSQICSLWEICKDINNVPQ